MSMPLSHFVPAYPSPSPCPQVHSLRLHFYSCPAPMFFRTFFFFRFHIYVLAYGICFSLSGLLHSVWRTLGPSTSLQITQFHFFLWLSNSPLYICATSFFFFKWDLFIYLFMAVLGLRFCARAFCSCGKRGPLFITVRGPLTIAASLVAEHRLQMRRLSNCGSWA